MGTNVDEGTSLGSGWTARLRVAPLGILLLGAILAIGGLGLVAGGLYLVINDGSITPWAGVTSLVTGPVLVYVAVHLVSLTRWTWLALMVLVGLLLASSILRFALSSGVPTAALAEIAIEATTAAYLTRPGVRALFGWGIG